MEAAEQQQNSQGGEDFLSQMTEKLKQCSSTQTIDDLCQNRLTQQTAFKKKFEEILESTEQLQQNSLHQQQQLKECICKLRESMQQLQENYKDQQDLLYKQTSEILKYFEESNKFENLLVEQQNEKDQQLAQVIQWGFESLFKQSQQITQLAQQNGKTDGNSSNSYGAINQQRIQQRLEMENEFFAEGSYEEDSILTGNFNASDIEAQSQESNHVLPPQVDIYTKQTAPSSHLQAQSGMDVKHTENNTVNGSENSYLASLTKNSPENGKHLGSDINNKDNNNSSKNGQLQDVGNKRNRDISALKDVEEVNEGKMQKRSSEQLQVGGASGELQQENKSDDIGQLKEGTSSISPTANKQPNLPTLDNSPSSTRKGGDVGDSANTNEDQSGRTEEKGKKTVKKGKRKVVGLKGVNKSKMPRAATTKKKAK